MDIKKVSKNSVMQNMAWRFGERILAQFTTFIVSVVLARKLTASAFGDVALLMVFIDIANVFVVQGFSSSLIQKKDADDIDFSSVFTFSLIVSIAFYMLICLFSPLTLYIGNQSFPAMFRVLALRIPLAAINSVQHAYVQKQLLFKKFFFRTLIGTIISAFVGIFMAYSGFGAWAIVGQYLTNSLCDTIILWCTIGWHPRLLMDFQRLKKLIDFGWKMLCSDLVHVIYNRLTTFFIGTSYSTADLAYYEQGQKIPGIIETNIDTTINSVLFPVMAAEQDDLDRIKYMVRKSIVTSGCIICPMMTGIAVLSDQIILFVYGKKWLPATIFMVIACFKLTLEPIQTANLQAVKAIGRSDLFFKMEVVKKLFGVIVIIIGVRISVLATAIASACQFIFSAVINGTVNSKLFNYRAHEQIKDIFINMGLSLLMGGIVYITKRVLPFNLILNIIIEILLGVSSYVVLIGIFNRPQLAFLVELVRERKK